MAEGEKAEKAISVQNAMGMVCDGVCEEELQKAKEKKNLLINFQRVMGSNVCLGVQVYHCSLVLYQ